MGASYVCLTFDHDVVAGLGSLVSRVGYLCPSPLRGKGLVLPVDYHLTVWYGFDVGVTAADVQAWLDRHYGGSAHLRFTGLVSHCTGAASCVGVGVRSLGLLQLNYCLGSFDGAFSPTYPIYRPHVTLGYFLRSFDLGSFPPEVCPFGPGGGLCGVVHGSRLDAWFVDGSSKARTALRLASAPCAGVRNASAY